MPSIGVTDFILNTTKTVIGSISPEVGVGAAGPDAQGNEVPMGPSGASGELLADSPDDPVATDFPTDPTAPPLIADSPEDPVATDFPTDLTNLPLLQDSPEDPVATDFPTEIAPQAPANPAAPQGPAPVAVNPVQNLPVGGPPLALPPPPQAAVLPPPEIQIIPELVKPVNPFPQGPAPLRGDNAQNFRPELLRGVPGSPLGILPFLWFFIISNMQPVVAPPPRPQQQPRPFWGWNPPTSAPGLAPVAPAPGPMPPPVLVNAPANPLANPPVNPPIQVAYSPPSPSGFILQPLSGYGYGNGYAPMPSTIRSYIRSPFG